MVISYLIPMLIGGWFISRGVKIIKTKDISKYGMDEEEKVIDKNKYIKITSHHYFLQGINLVVLALSFTVDEYYLNLSMLNLMLFTLIFPAFMIIEIIWFSKRKKEIIRTI